MSFTHREFFTAFLDRMNVPVRRPTLRTLAGVSIFESSEGTLHWFNPLACTLPFDGSHNLYPNVEPCAQVYRSFDDGVAASVQLFSGSYWDNVFHVMRTAGSREPMMAAWSQAYTWVTPRPDFLHLYTVAQLVARLDHALS